MNRTLEARAVAQMERRRGRLLAQLVALVAPSLTAAIRADESLLALVMAPEVNIDDCSTWGPELLRRGRAAFEAVVLECGAGRLVIEHDRLAARLTEFVTR